MKKRTKAALCLAAAAMLCLSGCQENQVVSNGNITTVSVSETTAPEVTSASSEETTTSATTTSATTTTTASATTTTDETSETTAPEEEPAETAQATTAANTAATAQTAYIVPSAPVQTTARTAAQTAAPAAVVPAETTKEHTSGYNYGNVRYEIKHDLEYMKTLNSDFVGWLKIDDTPIDLPVVQASDNKFYLTHDFYGANDPTKVGVTFADCHVPITATSRPDNIVIYGHNIRTGVGLAKITNYYPSRYGSLNFYVTHPVISYESYYGGQSNYVVFAGMYVNTQTKHGSVFNYHKFRNFGSKDVFYQYFEAVMDRSVFYNPDLDIKYGDKFLTLSTCYYPFGANVDTRFVVFAREVRPGETVISTKNAYTNKSPLYFDYYYQANGGSWGGRKWSESLIQGYSDWKAGR